MDVYLYAAPVGHLQYLLAWGRYLASTDVFTFAAGCGSAYLWHNVHRYLKLFERKI
jgi:hypothetical protein